MEDALIQMERESGQPRGYQCERALRGGAFRLGRWGSHADHHRRHQRGERHRLHRLHRGSLAGALKGFKAIDQELYQQFKAANPAFDFERVAQDLYAIASRNLGAGRADLV